MSEAIAFYLAVGFLVMVLLGYFFTALVSSGEISNKLAWALAPSVGMGIGSIIYFVFRRPLFTVELSLLAVLFALWLGYRKKNTRKVAWLDAGAPTVAAWLLGLLVWVTFASFIWIDRGPHGDWDGWAIWNSHARYLYRAGPIWQKHILDTAHPDYPLLIPAATARLWRYIGKDVPEAGGVQLVLIAISGVTVLAASLWELRKSSASFLMPLLLIGTPFYLILAISQYAEVQLSVYILITIALICVHWEQEPDHYRLLVLAGFTAGCAGWTKNEGLLFLVAVSMAMAAPILRQPAKTMRRLAMFVLGLSLPLAVTIYFKFTVPPPNDIVGNRAFGELVAKILDYSRYTTIGAALLNSAGSFGHWAIHPGIPLIAFLGAWGISRRFTRNGGWITGAAVLALTLTGYFAIYVITPLSLEYHLPTSVDRLLMHLWPALLLLAGLAVNTSASES